MGFLNTSVGKRRKTSSRKSRVTVDAASQAIEVMERRVMLSSTIGYNFGTTSAVAAPTSGTPVNFTAGSYSIGQSFGNITSPINNTSSSTYAGASGAFNIGNAYNNNVSNTALNTTTDPYYTVTLTPSSGFKVELDGFTFGSRSTSTGPTQLDVRSSIDNFATSLETLSLTANSTWTPFTSQTFAPVTGAAGAAVEVRLYLSGGSGGGLAGNSNSSAGVENNRVDDVAISAAGVSSTAITPVITSISPNKGFVAGGNTVLINGTGFTGASGVKFGGVAATSFTINSDALITAVAPAESAGQVDLTVSNSVGNSATSPNDAYTYSAVPVINSVSPATDTTPGGTTITLKGSGFTGVSAVKFGGVPATSFTVANDTTITAVDPAASSAGAVDITVTAPSGTSTASSTDTFTYTAATTIASVEATASSGTVVTLNDQPIVTKIVTIPGAAHGVTYTTYGYLVNDGTGSLEVYGVPGGSGYMPQVGDKISVTGTYAPFHDIPEVSTPTALTLISSNNSATTAPITVTIPQTNVPALPNNIAGYLVTLKGVEVTGLSNADGVFEAANLTGTVTDTSGNSQTLFYYATSFSTAVTNPDGSANLFGTPFPTGLVDIVGIASVLTSGTTVTPEFIPLAITDSTVAPVVTKVSPTAGPVAGQNTVTISGYGFDGSADGNVAPVSSVIFGGVGTTNFSVVNDNTITVNSVPASSTNGPQTVDVQVVDSNGTSATGAPDQYSYTAAPVIVSVSPTSGKANATTPGVVITGTGFSGASSVFFGSIAASFTVNSPTQITATAPSQAAGTVAVAVTTSSGTTSGTTSGSFTYAAAPSIVSIAPATGPLTGGTAVVITGTNFVAGATSVTYGGVAATTVTVTSATQLTAVVPAATVTGAVDVVVTTAGGSATLTGGFVYTANNIAAAEASPTGGLVTINSSPVITAILSMPGTVNSKVYGNYAILVQDSSGSLEVFGTLPSGSTYVPTVGDTISLSGTYSPFNSIPEIGTLTAIAKTGTAAVPAPLTKTVSQVNSTTLDISPNGVGEYLINLNNVTVSGLTDTFGITNLTGTITDSTGNSVTLYYYVTSYSLPNTNLNGQAVPTSTTPVNITGFADVFSSGTTVQAEFIPISITPVATTTIPAWLSSNSVVASYTPGSSITITSGTIINDPASVGDSGIAITISGGTVNTNLPSGTNTIHAGSVTIASSSTLSLRYNSTTLSTSVPVLIATSLNINASGSLDEANGDIDVQGGSVATLNAYVKQGFAGGLWNGLGGIDSTVAAANHINAIGVAPGGTAVSISGVATSATDAVAKYTFFGDANLSGRVDGTDYSRIDSAFTVGGQTGWYNGDFNYDTKINGSDYTLIDNAFNQEGTTTIAAQVAGPSAGKTTAVPDAQVATVITAATFSKKKLSMSIFEQLEQEISTN